MSFHRFNEALGAQAANFFDHGLLVNYRHGVSRLFAFTVYVGGTINSVIADFDFDADEIFSVAESISAANDRECD